MTPYETYASTVNYASRMGEELEDAERAALAGRLLTDLEAIDGRMVRLREQLDVEQSDRDEVMRRLYDDAKVGMTAIGRRIGVKRQTVHQGIRRARAARINRSNSQAPGVPGTTPM